MPISSFFISSLTFAVVVFLAVILFASKRLKKTWQDNPLSRRQLWIQKTFCTPRFWIGLLNRRNRSRLSRNPIGWLQQYSWSARMSKWGWCAVVIIIVSWLLAYDFQSLNVGCSWLKNAMLVSIAFSAVGSFQREKQNGALELLLVTPLSEKQIILGRLWGIWGQFLPAFALLLLAAVSVPDYYGDYNSYLGRGLDGLNIFLSICEFAVVPVVGLYFAMRLKNFMSAWALTCGLSLLLPLFVIGLCRYGFHRAGIYDEDEQWQMLSVAQFFYIVILGLVVRSFLFSQLKNRSFVVTRS